VTHSQVRSDLDAMYSSDGGKLNLVFAVNLNIFSSPISADVGIGNLYNYQKTVWMSRSCATTLKV